VVDFSFTDEQLALQRVAREFAEKELAPRADEFDRTGVLDLAVLKKAADLGFLGMTIPQEYGGLGLDAVSVGLILAELTKGCASTAGTIAVHAGIVSTHLVEAGSAEQKARYLPDMAAGRKIGAWCLTEPGAGSDPLSMQTTAVCDGDAWVLSGEKMFITNGGFADVYIVMAKTDPAAFHKGVSAFLVERDMGVQVSREEDKIGIRASSTAALKFDNVRVPKENLLGREGHGLYGALSALNMERLTMAAVSTGGIEKALEQSLEHAKRREQFGKPVYKFQQVYGMLVQLKEWAECAKLLWLKAAWEKEQGKDYGAAASLAKMYAAEASKQAALTAIQVHGGLGMIREAGVERGLRDSLVGSIGGGTTQVQKMQVARGLGLDINPYLD